jgi:hypothetical protein
MVYCRGRVCLPRQDQKTYSNIYKKLQSLDYLFVPVNTQGTQKNYWNENSCKVVETSANIIEMG